MSGLAIKPARGETVRLETSDGPVEILVCAPAHCRLKILAPPAVRVRRPDDQHPGPAPRPHFSPPSVRECRGELARALDRLNRSEGRTRGDTARIDSAGAILGDLIRRLDPREPERSDPA